MSSQARKNVFSNRLILFALIASVIFYWAGCSTTNPASEPQPVSQSQKTEAATKGLAKAPVSQSSSLEQLQQGKPVGSTPSSPLKDIYFDFDRYDLRADARDTLKANAEWLKQNPSATVQIEGHCDERGTAEYNLALGAKRTATAKDYLATLGIAD
jgi:peptidoglycan-associated lipoprotein